MYMENLEEISTVRGMIDNNLINNWDNSDIIPSIRSFQDETPIEELLHTLERERDIMENVLEENEDDEDEDTNIKIQEIKKFLYKYKNIKKIIADKTTRIEKIEKDMNILEDLIKEYETIIKKFESNFLLDNEIKDVEIKMTKLLKEKFLKIKIKNNNEIIKTKEKLNLYNNVLSNIQKIINESYEPESNFTCKICYTNECTHVIIPCGHLICLECKNSMENIDSEQPSLLSGFGGVLNMIGGGGIGGFPYPLDDPPSVMPSHVERISRRRRRIRPMIDELNSIGVGQRSRNKCHICRTEYTNMIKIFKI